MQHLSNSPGPVFIIQNKFKEGEMKPVQPIQKPDASSDVTLVSGDALVCKHFKFGFCKAKTLRKSTKKYQKVPKVHINTQKYTKALKSTQNYPEAPKSSPKVRKSTKKVPEVHTL